MQNKKTRFEMWFVVACLSSTASGFANQLETEKTVPVKSNAQLISNILRKHFYSAPLLVTQNIFLRLWLYMNIELWKDLTWILDREAESKRPY